MSKTPAAKKTPAKPVTPAPEPKTAKGKPRKTLDTGYALPADLVIMGRTPGYLDGEPGWDVELWDADRIRNPPSDDYVTSLIEHGHSDPVACVKRDLLPGVTYTPTTKTRGYALIVWNGRQRTMGTEVANDRIIGADAKAPPMLVPYFVTETANALDVTRANEFRLIDSPMVKARRAMHLKSLGYKEPDIIKSFSTDGAAPISKMTLINWKRAANCCRPIQEGFERGDYPITVCYEIGKIDHDDENEKERLQTEALVKILEEGGTLKGKAGRKNASDAAGEGEGEEEGEGNGGGNRAKGAGMSKPMIRELATRFEADDDSPFTDLNKEGKPTKEYEDGDFQLLASALLAAIVGDDPTGETLKRFPSVFHHTKKYLRSPKVD